MTVDPAVMSNLYNRLGVSSTEVEPTSVPEDPSMAAQAYEQYEELPLAQQLGLAVAPGTGHAIAAYETPMFAGETKEALEEGNIPRALGQGALTGLSALGMIPGLGLGIRSVKAAIKSASKLKGLVAKAVDEQGLDIPYSVADDTPLYGFHGTNKGERAGKEVFDMSLQNPKDQKLGPGAYFSIDPKQAARYANMRAIKFMGQSKDYITNKPYHYDDAGNKFSKDELFAGVTSTGKPLLDGQTIIRTDLSGIKNPFIARNTKDRLKLRNPEERKKLVEQGYDSAIEADKSRGLSAFSDGSKQIVVFPEYLNKLRTMADPQATKGLRKFSSEDIDIAKSTSRSRGAIGKKAVTPRYVAETSNPKDTILNYGAGADDIHTPMLREKGLDVEAHDFHNPNPEALVKKHDTVFGSNVINVQDTDNMLKNTLDEMTETVASDGRLIINLPVSPRKGAWTGDITDTKKLRESLEDRFENVDIVGGTGSAPIFEARIPKLEQSKPKIKRTRTRPQDRDYPTTRLGDKLSDNKTIQFLENNGYTEYTPGLSTNKADTWEYTDKGIRAYSSWVGPGGTEGISQRTFNNPTLKSIRSWMGYKQGGSIVERNPYTHNMKAI